MVSLRKILCLLPLVIIVVHVILLDKILRSYCLNDKNLTVFDEIDHGRVVSRDSLVSF